MVVIDVEENDDNMTLILKNLKDMNTWLIYSIAMTIEILNADYENIGSLRNLDITNTVRCGKHVKNCTLQNVYVTNV